MGSVTFHYNSLEDLAKHIEDLGREKIALAKKAEEEGKTPKHRILSETARGSGMIEAADMIRTSKIGDQS